MARTIAAFIVEPIQGKGVNMPADGYLRDAPVPPTRPWSRYEILQGVRGKGLMIGVEFGAPRSFKLKAAWSLLENASKGLSCQLITISLFKEHRILTQVAGHRSYTVKLLPPLIISDDDCDWIEGRLRHCHCGQSPRPRARSGR
jgi:ornithine--oxo-acid transaminase